MPELLTEPPSGEGRTKKNPRLERLALGTVQFGVSYGISNQRGRVPPAEAITILDRAYNAGVRVFDTAAQYGDAEQVLAEGLKSRPGLRIVTKTKLLKEGLSAVEERARRSAQILGAPIDAILVHSAGDLGTTDGEKLWKILAGLQAEGLFRRIGISAYADDLPLDLARQFHPQIVQVPLSLLDQRLLADGTLSELKSLGVEVHVRSIFLQGLLLMPLDNLPSKFARVAPDLLRVRKRIRDAGATPVQAALAFVLGRPEVDHIVVGVTRLEELEELIDAASAPRPELDWEHCALGDSEVLTPSLW